MRTITYQTQYEGFHQHTVLADGGDVGFYEKMGFVKPAKCQPLWIYDGQDHD